MRIGVIMGTGHGSTGTTGALVTQLLERVRAVDPSLTVEVDVVTTDDLDLGPSCPACLSCMTAGEQSCPSFERTSPARALMDAADLVVFATPVHSFHVSATMKRFVDHFAYLIHRPAYVGKPAVLVSTAAGAGHDAALGYLSSAVRRWGFHTVGQLGVNGPGLAKAPYREKVDRALDELVRTLHAQALDPVEPKQTVADLIGFRVARLLVEGGRSEGPVDAAYWDERGWFDADWFSDRPVPKLANRIAAMVEKKIRAGIEEGSAKPWTGGRARG
ncbi:flavodoxin family protein [Nocardioides jishulii]|uniref:NAD(P)H-dependent oxidoreductase n=1 Tax=Nocardioides jishulii TaxID=2575440 RepID=A0A4U2YJQ2_9ACTN|nr:NAD(P)H-dependent oxidoreductase [Nocardioides jishulii]QCX26923.1 NAD(P)H-dependent oxidoreductase [Nocardioides jishulii]TKI61406.1 NAD(P)H-dependent oxidoreductase [Nocardioides jishulii]